jgi:hypothetical protein
VLKRAPAPALVLALVAALSALSACGGGRHVSPPVMASTHTQGDVTRLVRAHLKMQVRGSETADLDLQTKLLIVEIYAGRTPAATWFVSVSAPTAELIRTPDNRTLLFTADLAPGLYRGSPGTYTLDATTKAPPAGGVQSPFKSAAYVRLFAGPPTPSDHNYSILSKPCTLKVAKEQVTGSVDCPELKDSNGARTVSLHWEWELT